MTSPVMDGREARKLWPICLHAFIFMVASLVAQQGHAVDLQPRSYTSQSGEFVLSVNPGDRSGAGKSTYTLTRGTKPQWSIELPFTFWDAAISNDGTFGGYAYSAGYDRDAGDFIGASRERNRGVRCLRSKCATCGCRRDSIALELGFDRVLIR